jgi:hypothetical protein
VQRHGRGLEPEAQEDQHRAEQQFQLDTPRCDVPPHGVEADVADRAVDERDPVQQHRGGERTDDEELQSGLDRRRLLAAERGEHEEGHRHDLERHEERHEVADRRAQEHAQEREQRQRVELPLPLRERVHVLAAHQEDENARHAERALEEERELVDDERAAEPRAALVDVVEERQREQRHADRDRRPAEHLLAAARQPQVPEHDADRPAAEDDLRQHQVEQRRVHRLASAVSMRLS